MVGVFTYEAQISNLNTIQVNDTNESEEQPEPEPELGPELQPEPEIESQDLSSTWLLRLKMNSNDGTISLIGSNDLPSSFKLQSVQIDFDNYENVNMNPYSWENVVVDNWVLPNSGNLSNGSISENGVNILTNTLEFGNTMSITDTSTYILLIGDDTYNGGNIPTLKIDSNNTQVVLYNTQLGQEGIITARKNPYEGELRLEIVND